MSIVRYSFDDRRFPSAFARNSCVIFTPVAIMLRNSYLESVQRDAYDVLNTFLKSQAEAHTRVLASDPLEMRDGPSLHRAEHLDLASIG